MDGVGQIAIIGAVVVFIYLVIKQAENYKKGQNSIRCMKCKNVMTIWKVEPINEEIMKRGEVYNKRVSEEVGYTETDNDGISWNTDLKDINFYSGNSKSRHYEYRDIPHQLVEIRHEYECTNCKARIGVRRSKEVRID